MNNRGFEYPLALFAMSFALLVQVRMASVDLLSAQVAGIGKGRGRRLELCTRYLVLVLVLCTLYLSIVKGQQDTSQPLETQ